MNSVAKVLRGWFWRLVAPAREREMAESFAWLTLNNAWLRQSARSDGCSTVYGWEVVTPDGNTYFSGDAVAAVRYARGGINPHFAAYRAVSLNR